MMTELDVLALKYKANHEFIESVIALLKDVLTAPDEFKDEPVYRSLRKEYLDFFNKFPWFEALQKHYKKFFQM
jgi:hypothetical protein